MTARCQFCLEPVLWSGAPLDASWSAFVHATTNLVACSPGSTGFLIDQGYGECDLPAGWLAVQADDAAGELDDEEAARTAARSLGSTCAYFPGVPASPELELRAGHGDWAVYVPRHLVGDLEAVLL